MTNEYPNSTSPARGGSVSEKRSGLSWRSTSKLSKRQCKTLFAVFGAAVLFLSPLASGTAKELMVPQAGDKWLPLTITVSNATIWDKRYRITDGKPWSSVINITGLALRDLPVKEQFETQRVVPIAVTKDAMGNLSGFAVQGDILPQATGHRLEQELRKKFDRFWKPQRQEAIASLPEHFSINIVFPSAETKNFARKVLEHVVLERCLSALEATGVPDTAGMKEIPVAGYQSTAIKSTWVSEHFPMQLQVLEKEHNGEVYKGCLVDNPFASMPTYLSPNDFTDLVDRWAQDARARSSYAVPKSCKNTDEQQFFLSQGPTESGQHIKVTYTAYAPKGGQFIMALASPSEATMCQSGDS